LVSRPFSMSGALRRLPPDRLAGTLWLGDDRGYGLRRAGDCFNHGSVPEVLEHGLTGFIVQDMDAAVRAVGRFTARRMGVQTRKWPVSGSRERRSNSGRGQLGRLAERRLPAFVPVCRLDRSAALRTAP
jgi:hypothetical protein